MRWVEEVLYGHGVLRGAAAHFPKGLEAGLKAVGAGWSLTVWVHADEDDRGAATQLFGQLGHACLFAGQHVASVPVFVAFAADDESGAAEDEVGPASGAPSQGAQGLVFSHGGCMKALQDILRPLMLDSRLSAGGFAEAGLADVNAIEWNGGMSHAEARVAAMCAEVMHEFEMFAQMV